MGQDERPQSIILGKDAEGRWGRVGTSNERLHAKDTDPSSLVRTIGAADLSSGELSLKTSGDSAFRLAEIFVKASQAITEGIAVVFDSKNGSDWDTVIYSGDLTDDDHFRFPDDKVQINRLLFESGDQVEVKCSDTGGAGIVRATIITEDI
ncbi:MAG: hypothetical protein KAX20_05615 [Candidatus Omnitrophica bacterium]|nr:hypothetical protein [Candidatus Omnitrophota bacterium]